MLRAVGVVEQVLLVAYALQPVGQQGRRRLLAVAVAGAVLQIRQAAAKFVQGGDGARAHRRAQRVRKQGFVEAELVLAGKGAELLQRLVPDAALGGGSGAQKGRVVVWVGQQAQPGAQVFDFGALKKPSAARHLIRYLRLAQGGFDRARLVVGAVQHGKVLVGFVWAVGGRAAQALDARDHALGLVLLVVAGLHPHRLALAEFAPQPLGVELGIGGDDVVGGAQYGAGGAVVLLQLDHLQRRKILRQALEVVQRGAAPAVDGLVVVADGGEVRARAHQQLEQLVLGGVGVLVFVDQHMAELRLPARAHLGLALQQQQRQADQIIEIHALVGSQPLLVLGHDEGDLALRFVLGLGQRLRGIEAGVFPAADGPLPVARRDRIGAGAAVFEQRGHVVAVENRELGLEAQRRAVLAQQPHPERMKGADQHLLRGAASQRAGALAHFGGGLVGEGDGGDALRGQPVLDQARDLVRDHARLARTGPGQHQARAAVVRDGLELSGVEAGGHGVAG